MFRHNAHQYLVFRAILKDLTQQCQVDAEKAGLMSSVSELFCKNHSIVTIMAQFLQYTVVCQASLVNPCPTAPSTIPKKRLDLAEAKASVQADADAIKERIQKEHQSFEYVNQTVEQALWCEVIKFLKQSQQEPEEIELSTETPQDLDQLSSRFSHAFCRLTVQSPMIYRQRAEKPADIGRHRQTMIGAVSRSDKAQVSSSAQVLQPN